MKLPESEKAWIGGGLALAVLAVLGVWVAAISPQLSSTSSLKSDRDNAETQNAVLLGKTNHLRADSKNLPQLAQQLADKLAALPITSDLADLTIQLNQQAKAAGVSLTSIAIGEPVIANSSVASNAATGNPSGKLFEIPVTIVSDAPLSRQKVFLKSIQQTGPRAALVLTTKLIPSSSSLTTSIDPGASMTTLFDVFVAPQSPAAAAQLSKQLAAGASN
jgi:hypothetical protein